MEGFIFYAIGENSRTNALRSIRSLRVHIPDALITLFTDNPSIFSKLKISTKFVSSVYSKSKRIEILLKTPYKRTFYIDSDTYFRVSCDEVFELLSDTSLVVAFANYTWKSDSSTPVDFPFLNSGVIGYKLTEKIEELFTLWKQNIDEANKINNNLKDEPILRDLLFSLNIHFGILPSKYNYRFGDKTSIPPPVDAKILHGDFSLIKLP